MSLHQLPARRPVTVVTVGAAAGLVLVLAAMPASAHAHLLRADPADGATLTAAPARVTLTFDENMRAPSAIVVTNPTGDRVESGGGRVVAKTASTRVGVARPGRYTIAFRVVSADGHPVVGQTVFHYQPGEPAASTASATPTTRPAPATGAGAHRHGGQGCTRSGQVVGVVAGLALLGAAGALTLRRRGSDPSPGAPE